ncbi:MAG: siderophore-interacting protein [Pseudomonadota bacterium]
MIRAGDLALGGRLPGASGALAAHIGAVYAGYDMDVQQPDGSLRIGFATGTLHFSPGEGGLSIAVTALSPTDLFVLREAVVSLIDSFDPALTAALIWDRPLARTAHPPNFRHATVVAVSRPGPHFARLRIAAADLSPFAINGLHLRLLLPPVGRSPVWPMVSDTGRTVWAKGEDALHDPVYTIRAIDPAAGWLEVDIYLHGRGRTCHWAASVQPGAGLGLIGPGGGFLLTARHLVLAGDETALPAIARLLQNAHAQTMGQALILVPSPAAIQPLAAPKGVTLRWLFRSAGDSLTTALAGVTMPPPGDRHLWVAGERHEVQALRALYCPATGWAKTDTTLAAYWTCDTP